MIDEAVRRGQLSSRGVDKVLRLAWSLADLAGRARADGRRRGRSGGHAAR